MFLLQQCFHATFVFHAFLHLWLEIDWADVTEWRKWVNAGKVMEVVKEMVISVWDKWGWEDRAGETNQKWMRERENVYVFIQSCGWHNSSDCLPANPNITLMFVSAPFDPDYFSALHHYKGFKNVQHKNIPDWLNQLYRKHIYFR